MNKDEIKAQISMKEVMSRYGVKINRSGMCCCPFHGEKHPSMKVYSDSYHCFACGADGDVFTFVMEMDKCDFKTAYLALGGTYEKQTGNQRAVAIAKRERAKSERERADKSKKKLRQEMVDTMSLADKIIKQNSPPKDDDSMELLSEAINIKTILEHWWECLYLNENEVDELNVYRKCKQFRFKINP